MKNFNYLWLFLIGLFAFGSTTAQDTLDVDPGLGTLNTAIATHGGDRIYQLQAGAWYGLDAIIENVNYHLQVVGEALDNGTTPTTLQTGQAADLLPLAKMFDAKGDITLKNIYFMNSDLTGQIADRFLAQSDSGGRVVIDNCVIDPIGKWSCVEMTGGDNDLFFTNNFGARHGHEAGANDGHCFIINDAAAPSGADSVVFENNTFVSTGMNWLSANFAAHVTNFLQINHNTFLHHKSQIDWSIFENEYYLTNNLFFDFMTAPYAYHWQPMPGGDVSHPKPMLIYADTTWHWDYTGGDTTKVSETLPSTRIQYIQYNSLFRHQGFYDLVAEMNAYAADSLNKVNLHPFIWDGSTPAYFGDHPDSTFAASREGIMFNHANNTNESFPMWKYGNYTYDVDPMFNDPLIYSMSDSLIAWTRPANYIHALGRPSTDWPPISEWAKWHWDPDGDPAVNDAWPVFDGTYTDAATLKGSIEYLPLGDLNWWPDLKAMWELDKDAIFAHMKAGNTDRMGLTAVQDVRESGSSFSKVYPNPLTTSATIEFSLERAVDVEISVYNPIGQRVKSVLNEYRLAGTHTIKFDRGDLQHGVYFYTIRAGNRTESHKIIVAQ